MKTIKNEDGSYTTTSSLGEALMAPYLNVNEWPEEERKFYDKKCKEYLDSILSCHPNPNLTPPLDDKQ